MANRQNFDIPFEKRLDVVAEAILLSTSIKVDELDCSKSCRRQPTKKTSQQILELGFEPGAYWTFILREEVRFGDTDHGELCINSMTTPDYFIWIEFELESMRYLIEKYKLKENI